LHKQRGDSESGDLGPLGRGEEEKENGSRHPIGGGKEEEDEPNRKSASWVMINQRECIAGPKRSRDKEPIMNLIATRTV
jgi:hypothetical protein